MKADDFFKHIYIDFYSATPKYIQLANCIIEAVKKSKIPANEILPSINELSFEFEISRDTVEKGYKYLKKIGVLQSVPGKGYFVTNASVEAQLNILLMFNKLSPHKKIIYDAFVAQIGYSASIDFYVYNNDFDLFKKILSNQKKEYSHYVIIPHFFDDGDKAYEIINTIDKSKLIIADKLLPKVTGSYGAVYQNFEKDIYDALVKCTDKLAKYHTLKIIMPNHTYHPREIIDGFENYCSQYAFSHQVVNDIHKEEMRKGEAYINLVEDDLITLLEKVKSNKLVLGKDLGIISYNETPLKQFIMQGLTTISTNFQVMGEKMAYLVLNKSTEHIEIPFSVCCRASI